MGLFQKINKNYIVVVILMMLVRSYGQVLYQQGCFPLHVTYRCASDLTGDVNTCNNARYFYTVNVETQSPINITIDCPINTYINLTGQMDYILPSTVDSYCLDRNENCLYNRLCQCCTATADNRDLCFSPSAVEQRYTTDCNSGVRQCQLQVQPKVFYELDWQACQNRPIDYRCETPFQSGPNDYPCNARWVRVYYSCIDLPTSTVTTLTTPLVTVSTFTPPITQSRPLTTLSTPPIKLQTSEQQINESTLWGLVAGVIVLLIVVLLLVTVIIVGFIYFRRKLSETTQSPPDYYNMNTNTIPSTNDMPDAYEPTNTTGAYENTNMTVAYINVTDNQPSQAPDDHTYQSTSVSRGQLYEVVDTPNQYQKLIHNRAQAPSSNPALNSGSNYEDVRNQ